jgi:hypothetical protein
MANALVIGSTVMQADARITQQNFTLANMVYLPSSCVLPSLSSVRVVTTQISLVGLCWRGQSPPLTRAPVGIG